MSCCKHHHHHKLHHHASATTTATTTTTTTVAATTAILTSTLQLLGNTTTLSPLEVNSSSSQWNPDLGALSDFMSDNGTTGVEHEELCKSGLTKNSNNQCSTEHLTCPQEHLTCPQEHLTWPTEHLACFYANTFLIVFRNETLNLGNVFDQVILKRRICKYNQIEPLPSK